MTVWAQQEARLPSGTATLSHRLCLRVLADPHSKGLRLGLYFTHNFFFGKPWTRL